MDAAEIKIITDLNHELKKDIKDSMKDQSTVISARVDLKIEEKMAPIVKSINEITEHNKKQNGWVKEHQEAIEILQAAEISNKVNRKTLRWIKKNWLKVTIGVIITLFLLNSLFDYVTLKDIITWVKLFK